MNRFLKCSALLVAVIQLTIGCSSQQKIVSERNLQENDYILTTVGDDYSISLPEFHQKLNSSDLFGSGGIISSDLLRPILDSIVLDTVMGLKADMIDLSKYPDAYRSFFMRANELMIRTYLENVIYPRISFDSTEVLAYYKTNGGRYYVEEQVFAYNLIIKPDSLLKSSDSLKYQGLSEEELIHAGYKYMMDVLAKMKEGRSFAALVGEYTHDEISARQQGELGWTPRGKYQHPFDSVAFALKKGEISKPYYDRNAWHLIFVEDYYEEGIPEMTEEIFPLVVQNYITETSNQLVGSIRDSLLFTPPDILFNDKIIDSDLLKSGSMEWVAIINGADTVRVFDIRALEQQWRLETGNKISDRYVINDFVSRLADNYVLIQHARKNKIDTLPHVAEKLYRWRHEYGRNILWAKKHERSFRPSDSSIENYYNDHFYDYNSDQPYYVQSITVEDSLTAVYARTQAEAGADFDLLTEQFSSDEPEVASKKAVLRWVGENDLDERTYSYVSTTPRGGISRIFKSENGYQFYRLADMFENRNVSRVRHLITTILRNEHDQEIYAAFRDKLFKEFDVKQTGKLPSLHLKPSDYR